MKIEKMSAQTLCSLLAMLKTFDSEYKEKSVDTSMKRKYRIQNKYQKQSIQIKRPFLRPQLIMQELQQIQISQLRCCRI